MRKLSTIQKRENLNEVFSMDEVGPGNAHHYYLIQGTEPEKTRDGKLEVMEAILIFQTGARYQEGSLSGVIDSDLLEIVRDRLTGFQSGDFASEYNAKALEHVELALMYMNRRVEDRIERNVLGTDQR
ncbi:MAG: ABC transporter ATPase [Lachnospiraceae bacterium]|nr:ABC transporter ATPase [Lachnospiraceae bacterium]